MDIQAIISQLPQNIQAKITQETLDVIGLIVEAYKGDKGDPGVTPHIGTNLHWWIGTTDTGIAAQGAGGVTPHIGTNNHWYVGNTDTGILAEGQKGDPFIYSDFTPTQLADLRVGNTTGNTAGNQNGNTVGNTAGNTWGNGYLSSSFSYTGLSNAFTMDSGLAYDVGTLIRLWDVGGFYTNGQIVTYDINTGDTTITSLETNMISASYTCTISVVGQKGGNGLNADMTRQSTTSITLGMGNTTYIYFTVPSLNLGWIIGTRLRMSKTSNQTIYQEGVIASISSTDFRMTVDLVNGSGTYADWNISIVGEKGSDATVNATNVELVLDAASADTLADADTINFNKSSVLKKITWANFKVALNSLYVRISSPKFTADVNLVGTYKYYRCTSDTADTVDDDRSYYSGHVVVYEKCTIANVAKGGGTWVEYARLSGSNTGDQSIPAAQIQSDWTQANNALLDYVKNKPASFTPAAHKASHITGGADIIDSASTAAVGLAPIVTAPAAGNLSVLGVVNGETVRTDKLIFDNTAPTTQAFGDAAVAGTTLKFASIGHKHAMPANPVAYASTAETTTGSEAAKSVTPDGLAGSLIFGVKSVQIQVVADATDVDGTSGLAYFFIPQSLNGMNLIRATAMVATAGTTNATTIQVRNLTKYSSNDALGTAISIASTGTIATAGTVDTNYDDVSTNDKIKIYVTAQSTTKPKGLYVVLEYQLP